MTALLATLAVAYLGIAALMVLLQDRLLYLPSRQLAADPGDAGLAFESLQIPAADGVTLHAWFIPAPGARHTLLHFHGNAGNIGDRVELARLLHGLGIDLLLLDYRGYGRSGGAPGEEGTYRDAEAAWRYLVAVRGLAPGRIVLHGQSMGGPIAAWLAARVQPAALILDSTFTSIPDLGAELYRWLPVRLLSRLRYDTRAALANVRCPLLVIHSRDDEIIGYHHGQRLLESARGPRRLLELRGDHNGAYAISREAYIGGIRSFLDGLPKAPSRE